MAIFTKAGQAILSNMQYVAGAGSGVLFGASLLPQTLGLGRYRKILAKYKDGEEEPLNEDIKNLTETISYRIDMSPQEQAGLEFFTVTIMDLIHKGSVKIRTGAFIGIPANFSYSSPDQVETDKIDINNRHNKPIDWNSQTGQTLLKSLILSENAKSFGIAREIAYTNTHHLYVDGLMRSLFGVVAYITGFTLNNRFLLKVRMKRWGRLTMYATIGAVYYLFYQQVADTHFCYRDGKADKFAAQMSQEFAEGGVEYYTKLIQRNQSLRKLMGAQGGTRYTVYGNEPATWRRPHLQPTERKDNVSKILKSYHEQSAAKAKLL